jgi:hypothetical protein
MIRMTTVLLLLAAVGTLVVGFKYSRLGVESPIYEVIHKEGAFEIRSYPTLVTASTPMFEADPSEGSSFMRLYLYISGSNLNEQEIAMTTPVITSGQPGQLRMSFIVPEKVASAGAPPSLIENVSIDTLPAGSFATYRFNGSWNSDHFKLAKIELAKWMARQDISAVGTPMIANYDPPFTPSFLKRNEIMVEIRH